jgi:hypothetical protein
MSVRLARHISTAAVVIALQLTATMMTLRRDPVLRLEGAATSGLLWVAFRPRD